MRFLRGDVSDSDSDRIAAHVDECSDCQQRLSELEETRDPVLGLIADGVRPEREPDETPPLDHVRKRIQLELEQNDREAEQSTTESEFGLANESPSRTLGQYDLHELIGQGGMGAVYKARHRRLQRTVALKLLPERLLRSDEAVARFDREMRAAGVLHHPNIVHATDAGEVNGVHFIAMEYVDGIDVSSLSKNTGPMRIADACEIIRQAALGLQHAHDSGLIHRDVKPSNLLLSRDGTVKLLDLGLARIQSDDMLSDELTSTAQIMGTVDYMAPEQADNSHEVDTRADIYSLGATLFRLLSGIAPLDTHDCRTPIQKLTALVNTARTPITDLRSDVPEALVTLIQSLLAKAPDERPGSAAAVAQELLAFNSNAELSELAAAAVEHAEGESVDGDRVAPSFFGPEDCSTLLSPVVESTETLSTKTISQTKPTRRSRHGAGRFGLILMLFVVLGTAAFVASQNTGWFHVVADNSGSPDGTTSKSATGQDISSVNDRTTVSGNDTTTKRADTRTLEIDWIPGTVRNGLPGFIPAPAELPDIGTWQVESKYPRGQVFDVECSPDGRWLACTSSDLTLRLYSLVARQPEFVAALPFAPPYAGLYWGPLSKRLAISQLSEVGARTSKVLIMNVDEPGKIHEFTCDGWAQKIGWAPDGTEFIASSHQHFANWTVTGELRWKREIDYDGTRMARNPISGHLAIGGTNDIRIHDSQTGKVLSTFKGHGSKVQALEWSRDGNFLASGASGWNSSNGDTSVRIWSVDGDELARLQLRGSNVSHLAWSSDGTFLAAGADMVKVWKISKKTDSDRINCSETAIPLDYSVHRGIRGLSWAASQQLWFAGLFSGPGTWTPNTGVVEPWFPASWQIRDLTWGPSGEKIATVSDGGIICNWRGNGTLDGSRSIEVSTPTKSESDFAWSPDGALLAINTGTGNGNGLVVVCPSTPSAQSRPINITTPRSSAGLVSWAPDSQRLAISTHHGTPRIFCWDRATQLTRQVGKGQEQSATVTGWLGWDPANGQLMNATVHGRVHRLDPDSGQTLSVIAPDDANFRSQRVCVSPDLDCLLAWSPGMKCFDLKNDGQLLWSREDMNGPTFAAWHPTHAVLCVAEKSGSPLQLLDADTGKTIGSYGSWLPSDASWSPDGNQLAVWFDDSTIHLWDYSPTGVPLPSVVGVTLPDGQGASFTATGKPVSLSDEAAEHLTWVLRKTDGSLEFLSRTEFEGRLRDSSDETGSGPDARTAVLPFSSDEATRLQEEWAHSTGLSVEVNNSIGMTFRLIPAGEFQQGSSRVDIDRLQQELKTVAAHEPRRKLLSSEVPPHLAWVDAPFYMATTEVTQEQFGRFVKATGHVTEAEKSGRGGGGWIGGKWVENPNWIWSHTPNGESRDDHPVVNVSWNDAKAFCQWLSDTEGVKYDLPTETQWEFACRAGSLQFFPERELDAVSWFEKNSDDRTHPVAKKEPNIFGLHDMIGNAYEWCSDWYTESGASDPRTDRVVAERGRTRSMRSSAFHSGPDFLRPAHRLGGEPERSYYDVGFRVVRVAERGRADQPSKKRNGPKSVPVTDPLADYVPGCVYYWPMNDGEGRVSVAVGTKPAQFSGSSDGPEWTTDSAPISHDNPTALSFDGVDDSLDLGRFSNDESQWLLSNGMTLSFWLKSSAIYKSCLLGLWDQSTYSNSFQFMLNDSPAWVGAPPASLLFYISDKDRTRFYNRAVQDVYLCDGEWHHLALSWHDRTLSMCRAVVDGNSVGIRYHNADTKGWPHQFGPLFDSVELGIMKLRTPEGKLIRELPFKGILDELRVYHRVLNTDEIGILARRPP